MLRLMKNFKLMALFLFLLIFVTVIAISSSSFFVSAAGTHGVNGYVYNCNPLVEPPFEVNGSDVTFQLFWSNNTVKDVKILSDIVGAGRANLSGWYAVDVGNFDKPWKIGDIVLINITKEDFVAFTNVTLTEAGNDQAFAVCLGPGAWNWSCACGNDVCEWWVPLCENHEFEVGKTFFQIEITTKRCPEDCGHCKCGNGICQADCGEDAVDSLTYCPEDCHCGDGTCQPKLGENPVTCIIDCPEIIEGVEYPGYILFAMCGNKKCEGAETQENCCLDCGCPERKGCHVWKCTPEYKWKWFFKKIQIGRYECREQCCFIGYCNVWLGLCWYWWILIIIIIAAAIIIYMLTRPSLEKSARALAKIRKTKSLILADKIVNVNEFEKWLIKK